MKFISFFIFTIVHNFCFGSLAFAGNESGGGDLCENRIQVIRDDMKSWIKEGGAKELKLSKGVSLETYKSRMLKAFSQTKISCVGKGDAGYPISVTSEKTPKTCKFEGNLDKGKITCDFEKFSDTIDSDQYVLIHHEFAGIAGLEKPNGDISSYALSNQISGHLIDVVVKKLSVDPSYEDLMKNEVVKKFLKEANDPSSNLGKTLIKLNEESKDGRNNDGTISFPVKAQDLKLMILAKEEINVPWHYANLNEAKNECTTEDFTANLLVTLERNEHVHYASHFDSLTFSVDGKNVLKGNKRDHSQIPYCQDVIDYERDGAVKTTYDVKNKIEVGDFKQIEIPSSDN